MSRDATARSSEPRLGEREFKTIVAMTKELTGIQLGKGKEQMVERRLASRLRALGMRTFAEYLSEIERANSPEIERFINAVTTNLTAFFRENHHFEFFNETAIVPFTTAAPGTRLRIWSAGCSTGEEPYSIAISLCEALPNIRALDAKILATDLDSDVVATASAGVYPASHLDKLPRPELRRWFVGESDRKVGVQPRLRELITFKQLNLLRDWPMRGPFDIIFCRNVMIYFDKPTQRELVARFADILAPGGYLFVGHSESLFNVSSRFRLIGKTIYQKSA